MRTPLAASGLLALLGCQPAPAPAPAPAPVAARPAPVDTPAPSPPASPCERAAVETRRVLAEDPRAVDAGLDLAALRATFTGHCIPDARGAWALVPERLRVEARAVGRGWWARYALARLGAEGGRLAVVPAAPSDEEDAASATPFNLWSQAGESEVTVVAMSAYDYDRDGSPEVVLALRSHEHEGPTYTQAHVWTVTEGGVFLYERTLGLRLSGVRDVDGDGRPDLLMHGVYDEASVACGSDFATQVRGPELALHALPDGTFSATDAVARGAARAACPARPARLLARTAEGAIDHEGTARNVACARLWGAPEAEVAAAVRRECPPADPEAPCAGCEDVELLLRWAHAAPPLSITDVGP